MSESIRALSEAATPDKEEPMRLDPDDELMCDHCLRTRKRRFLRKIGNVWICRAKCEFVR